VSRLHLFGYLLTKLLISEISTLNYVLSR
jgi:hypothetical protein